ncbi:MAG: AMP-dependent synthetase/ligase [Candidatus Krumholzibacteriia bacterium]
MNFLERILDGLLQEPDRTVLQEAWAGRVERATCRELLAKVGRAHAFLRQAGLRKGARCVLLANNSIHWVAMDLAIMAEGILKVPMYARQSPAELVKMMQDCSASLIVCGDEGLRAGITEHWSDPPPIHLLDEAIGSAPASAGAGQRPVALQDGDPVTILYTSGTSGDSKGVILNVGNLNHMLPCTLGRLDDLMQGFRGQERVFHYLPFCFAGSWILLLSSLARRSLLTLATDLDRLADQMKVASPHYFLNVPILLDRIRSGVDARMKGAGGLAYGLHRRAIVAWGRAQEGRRRVLDRLWLGLARVLVFRRVKRKISPNLVALICGSAPLSADTQRFFEMMGIPVLQVYGLTETTAICTMDRPQGPRQPGRVGYAVPGIEMKLSERDEILVRGPNVFAGYWERPEETAACFRDGWFRTGDQGEVDPGGNWRIIGRVTSVIVLSSGHNVAPDPIEERLRRALPGAEQVLVVGHERKHLTAIVTGDVSAAQVDAALEELNPTLPHYERVRAYHIHEQPFSVENGFLTANGKLKRRRVLEQLGPEIEVMYGGDGS